MDNNFCKISKNGHLQLIVSLNLFTNAVKFANIRMS